MCIFRFSCLICKNNGGFHDYVECMVLYPPPKEWCVFCQKGLQHSERRLRGIHASPVSNPSSVIVVLLVAGIVIVEVALVVEIVVLEIVLEIVAILVPHFFFFWFSCLFHLCARKAHSFKI